MSDARPMEAMTLDRLVGRFKEVESENDDLRDAFSLALGRLESNSIDVSDLLPLAVKLSLRTARTT